MKKKTILAGLVSSLLLASCGGGGGGGDTSGTSGSESAGGSQASVPSDRIAINFINGFTGGDGAFMREITDSFNESQDQYFVNEVQEPDHYTKFNTGDFDMVVIHGNNLPTFVMDQRILELSAIMEQAELSLDDFHPAAEEIVNFDDGTYALPLDIHPLTTFYNKQLTDTAPETYEDLVALNSELQAQDPNLYAIGVPDSGLVEFYTLTIAAQNNVNLLKDGYLNFAQPEMAEALMTFHDMVWKDKISPPNLGLDGEFQAFMKQVDGSGSAVQTAVSLTGPWYYQAVSETYGEDLGIGQIPVLGENPAVYGNSHTIAVNAAVTDQEVLDGIAAFFQYMYQPDVLINWAASGQAPLHKGTMDLVAEQQDQYPLSFQNQSQFDNFAPAPQVYQYGEQMRYMNETVFGRLVREENLTMDDLMQELETATQNAKDIAATGPQQ